MSAQNNVNIEALDAKMKELIEYVYIHLTPSSYSLNKTRAATLYTRFYAHCT
jgi:uncharacterized protein YktB (UPF0637 family)